MYRAPSSVYARLVDGVRVEDPVSLASWILRDQPEWTAEKIQSAMYGEKTIRAALSKPSEKSVEGPPSRKLVTCITAPIRSS
jgi:hypothetical protein